MPPVRRRTGVAPVRRPTALAQAALLAPAEAGARVAPARAGRPAGLPRIIGLAGLPNGHTQCGSPVAFARGLEAPLRGCHAYPACFRLGDAPGAMENCGAGATASPAPRGQK